MKKVRVKIPAKINLTLDVVGVKDGYHEISSLVTGVNLYDYITVKKRSDKKVTLTEKGIKAGCITESNNAYKTAILFMHTFKTNGVDIILKKNIPVGGGLGGSSADIAGVLLAMKKLFGIKKDVKSIADSLGSDSGYMTSGGLAIISGRGDKVFNLKSQKKFNLLILAQNKMVSAGESYRRFDEQGVVNPPVTDKAVSLLQDGNVNEFLSVIKNDLYLPSASVLPEIRDNINAVKNAFADKVLMTGSGSAVYGIFLSKAKRNKAYKQLKATFGKYVIKAKTLW